MPWGGGGGPRHAARRPRPAPPPPPSSGVTAAAPPCMQRPVAVGAEPAALSVGVCWARGATKRPLRRGSLVDPAAPRAVHDQLLTGSSLRGPQHAVPRLTLLPPALRHKPATLPAVYQARTLTGHSRCLRMPPPGCAQAWPCTGSSLAAAGMRAGQLAACCAATTAACSCGTRSTAW